MLTSIGQFNNTMHLIFFDDENRQRLLPLTFTRPVAEIRLGILTLREKWERRLGAGGSSFRTADYLRVKYGFAAADDNLWINGSVIADEALVAAVQQLEKGSCLRAGEVVIAARTDRAAAKDGSSDPDFSAMNVVEYGGSPEQVRYPWDIFSKNGKGIEADFALLTKGRKSAPLSASNRVIAPERVFLEPGAKAECAILNASAGPIFIGKDAEVMEGAMIRGPFALCEHSTVKMGAKIYEGTTFGPECKVGGEVSNSVIFGYSNKAHDGFLGNSVLGEWCNLGADSNNSNLKNNYSMVKVWSYEEETYVNTRLQFCGLIMGDHSKCSINTMFNTGTVVGVSANIFGTGFPPKFVPSFAWGGSEGFSTYRIEEAIEVASRVFERRKLAFNEAEQRIFRHLYDSSTKYRAW